MLIPPFIRRMKLRHLNFRKIGVNCRFIQELDFKQNGMPMAHVNYHNNIYTES